MQSIRRPRRTPLAAVSATLCEAIVTLLAPVVAHATARAPVAARGLAVVAVLVTAGSPAPTAAQPSPGLQLARELGCGACHEGMPDPEVARAKAPRLGPDATPLPARFVFDYLADPQPRRPEIAPTRMPDFRLSEDERLALALFLGAEGAEGVPAVRTRHPGITAGDGRLLFAALGCAGCHGHAEVSPLPPDRIAPRVEAGRGSFRDPWLSGFLRTPTPVRPTGHLPGTGSRMPDFRLDEEETEALVALIQAPGREAVSSPAPPTAWGRARAETYLRNRLACLGCHEWRGEGGVIAPPLDGVAARITPSAVSSTVHDPAGTRAGTSMPRSLFRPGILDEVVALLNSDDRRWQAPDSKVISWPERRAILQAVVATDSSSGGRDLYRLRCAQCHGVEGNGAGFNAVRLPVPPTAHADSTVMSARPDDTLYDGIAAGGWVLDRSHRMPAFRESLTREQIQGLVTYIRELCRCSGPEWSRREAGS